MVEHLPNKHKALGSVLILVGGGERKESCIVPLLCGHWKLWTELWPPIKWKGKGLSMLSVCAYSTSDYARMGWYLRGYWLNEFPQQESPSALGEEILVVQHLELSTSVKEAPPVLCKPHKLIGSLSWTLEESYFSLLLEWVEVCLCPHRKRFLWHLTGHDKLSMNLGREMIQFMLWVMRQRAEAELSECRVSAPGLLTWLSFSLCEMVCLLDVEAYARTLLCVIKHDC